ncbi:15518_t:CDS:1, partial [Gigaspora rosea]
GSIVMAVLDSEAAVSIISRRLFDKLQLRIDEESTTMVVTATGSKTKTL